MNKYRILAICFIYLCISSVISAQNERPIGLAVLDLQANGVSEIEAVALSDILRSSIGQTILEESGKLRHNYELIERSQMDKIFDQFEIQNTGCTDLACAVEFGKLLNADHIIIGSVNYVGSTYIVVARIITVETGKTIASVDRRQQGIIDNVIDLMPIIGHELLTGERLARPVPSITTAQPSPSLPTSQPNAQFQYLSVSGSPNGATVILNNTDIGESPIDFRQVNPGRYSITITKDGYTTHKEELIIPPGRHETIQYSLIPQATLTLSGSPEGASIILNEEEIGKTPLRSYSIDPGRYSIIVRKEGYRDVEDAFTLITGEDHTITYEMAALSSISIVGMPDGAHVSIDDQELGRAPIQDYTVTEGQHTVEVSLQGYDSFSEEVTIENDSPASVSYFLIPKTKGGVIVRSLLLPGAGQYYAGYKSKGGMISLLQAMTLGGVVYTTLSTFHAWTDYDDAKAAYANATSGDFDGLYSELETTHDTALTVTNIQLVAVGLAAAVYVYNIIDAFGTTPLVEIHPTFDRLNWQPHIGRDFTGISAEVSF